MGIKALESDKLKYVGKASLGLKGSDLSLLKEYKNELIQEECPFDTISISNITGSELTWMIPSITCWINFLELSDDGHFRHPKIIGFTALSAEEAKGRVFTE